MRPADGVELCESCNAHKQAAAAVIRFFAEAGGRDIARSADGAHLTLEWTEQGMARPRLGRGRSTQPALN
ncbi:DUF6300 family protein [Streptomyces sp. NPDC005548]